MPYRPTPKPQTPKEPAAKRTFKFLLSDMMQCVYLCTLTGVVLGLSI